MNPLLFPKPDFRIVRLKDSDVRRETDDLRSFRNLVLECEEMYPGIRTWLDKKVLPGLRSRERVAFVGYEADQPVVSALIKKGERAKFCHLRIRDNFQNLHLGETFFALMALEVRHLAKEIHFTLPESLWLRELAFFKSFGFGRVVPSGTQYRLFDRELRSAAPFSAVWRAVLEKLPKLKSVYTVEGFSMDNRLLMSIKPEYATRIFRGAKITEVRRRFSGKWTGARVSLYASDPVRAIVGEVTIGRVVSGEPTRLWDEFRVVAGCSKQEYDDYVAGAKEVSIVFLEDVRPYPRPIPLAQIRSLLAEEVRPPLSYCSIDSEHPWGRAIALAALLHGNFSSAAPPSRQTKHSQGKGARLPDAHRARPLGAGPSH